nr:MAG TPA: hypothetical protein [Caudoviricetes sp.]
MNKRKIDWTFGLGCILMVLLIGLYCFLGAVILVFAPLFVANYFGWNYVIVLVIWWMVVYLFKSIGGKK